MKWNVLLAILVVAVFSSSYSCAQQVNGYPFYIGIGASYNFETFDYDGFDDSWGGNLKIGYSFNPLGEIEFVLDYIDSFDYDESFDFGGSSVDQSGDMELLTYMVAVKGGFPISNEDVKLFVVVGAGLMTADFDGDVTIDGSSYSAGDSDTDFCAKVGLALDVYVTPQFSIGAEGNYTQGFSDLDDIRYIQCSLGASFHF